MGECKRIKKKTQVEIREKKTKKKVHWKNVQHTLLHLLDGLLLLIDSSAEERKDDASLRVDTDRCYNHFSTALHHMRSRENHRIEFFALLHVIRLARERRFVDLEKEAFKVQSLLLSTFNLFISHLKIIALNQYAIGGQQVTIFDLANIADNNLAHQNHDWIAITDNRELMFTLNSRL